MRIRLAAVIALAACSACAQNTADTLSREEAKEGWKLLFDGQTLNGWEPLPTSSPGSSGDWKIENGAIVCPGTSAGWLASKESFSDYQLRLEFRGGERVNSGVFLRSQHEGQPHITGYELQIWDYQPAGFNTGSLVGSIKAEPTKIKADQWNDYDITVDGDHYVVLLNGTKLLDAHDSKHVSGRIGFQCQKSNPIEFRSIRVRPISH